MADESAPPGSGGPESSGSDIPQFKPPERPRATPGETEATKAKAAEEKGGATAGLHEVADLREVPLDPRAQAVVDSAIGRINSGEDVGRVLSTVSQEFKGAVQARLDQLTTPGDSGGGSDRPSAGEAGTQDGDRQSEMARLAGNINTVASARGADFRQGLEEHVEGLQVEPASEAGDEKTIDDSKPEDSQERSDRAEARAGDASEKSPKRPSTDEGQFGPEEIDEEEAIRRTLERMSEDRLQGRLGAVDKKIASLERKQDRLSSLDDINKIQDDIDNLNDEREIIANVMEEKGFEPKTKDGGTKATNADRQEAMEKEAKEFAEIQESTPEELKKKLGALTASRDYLKDRAKNAPDVKDRQAASAALKKIEAQIEIVEGLESQKSEEQETDQAEEDREQAAKELEKLQREAADPEQLRVNIKDWEEKITDLEDEIDLIDEQLEGIKDEKRKTKLEKDKSELTDKLVEARKTLKKEQDALKEAQKRERDEFTLKEKMSQDTLREVSREDYLKMDEGERAKYLQEIMEVTKDSDTGQISRIQTAIGKGEPLSIEDRAQYARYLADRIISQGGRGDLELEYFMGITAEYPEMAQAVFDRATRAESAKNMLKEKFPNNWEKMISFAKRNPAWMAILLALLVGGAAAVGAAVAPAAGIGLGLGGAGAASGGAGVFGSRGRR